MSAGGRLTSKTKKKDEQKLTGTNIIQCHWHWCLQAGAVRHSRDYETRHWGLIELMELEMTS